MLVALPFFLFHYSFSLFPLHLCIFLDPFKVLFKNYPSFLTKIQSLFKKSKPTYIYLNKGSKNGLWTCYCRPNGHGEWFKRRNNVHVNYAQNVCVNVTSGSGKYFIPLHNTRNLFYFYFNRRSIGFIGHGKLHVTIFCYIYSNIFHITSI